MSNKQFPDVVMPECPAERILKGQKALVTGSASGIGKAVAIALGKAGADVVVNYRSGAGQANEVVAEIEKIGSRAYAHQADVSKENQVAAMFEKMKTELGTIIVPLHERQLLDRGCRCQQQRQAMSFFDRDYFTRQTSQARPLHQPTHDGAGENRR